MLIAILSLVLSFAFVIVCNALFWKLAARILRYGGVTWGLAFLTGTTLVFASAFVRGMLRAMQIGLPILTALPLSVALTVMLGAWCFHDRATGPNGVPVDWPGALKLSGLALALFLAPALLLLAVLPFMGIQ
jgi:hypothetical protein